MKLWTPVRIVNLCAIGFAVLIPLFLVVSRAAGRDDQVRQQSRSAAPQAKNTIAGIDKQGTSSQEPLLRNRQDLSAPGGAQAGNGNAKEQILEASYLPPAPFRSATNAATVKSPALSQGVSAIEAGRQDFERYGCKYCHGADLKGGVPNPNAQGGVVPGLVHVSEDYTNEEILNLIRDGRTAPLDNSKGITPPIYMPQWKKIINDQYIHDILSYLQSKQEKKTENW